MSLRNIVLVAVLAALSAGCAPKWKLYYGRSPAWWGRATDWRVVVLFEDLTDRETVEGALLGTRVTTLCASKNYPRAHCWNARLPRGGRYYKAMQNLQSNLRASQASKQLGVRVHLPGTDRCGCRIVNPDSLERRHLAKPGDYPMQRRNVDQ